MGQHWGELVGLVSFDTYGKTVQYACGVLAVSTPSSIELIAHERKEICHLFLGIPERDTPREKKKIKPLL